MALTQVETTFLNACQAVTGTGAFHSAGEAPFFFPKLRVAGLEELSFPVPTSQAEVLLAHAEAAPYGQGERTIHDERVRKCRQIDAAELSIDAPEWEKFLKGILKRVREDLGIDEPISAHLYKLLVYGPGGHFKKSRPYTLLCTKNSRSYERALDQRQADETLLAQLLAIQTNI